MNFTLSLEEKRTLISIARKSLETYFRPEEKEDTLASFRNDPTTAGETLQKKLPCFVTLVTKDKQLRGCIGCMETGSPLLENAFHYARRAAFQDPRFRPVEPEELNDLFIEISVLGPMEPLPSLAEVEIGTHGLYVSHGMQGGVLLAKVAIEYHWSKEEFLHHTCLKAGLDPEHTQDYEVLYFAELSFTERELS